MDPNEIRAKYWKWREKYGKLNAQTLERDLQTLQFEMLAEICAQLAEINSLLKSTIGIINIEKLALDLGKVTQQGSES